MDSFVFVHIPKSAGTSFRLGADQYFGERMVCSDYGPKTQETSEDVKDWIYKGNNFWGFTKAFREKGYRYLAGHFPAIEYALLFGVEHMITLMRDPVQLVISEYNHFDGIRPPLRARYDWRGEPCGGRGIGSFR